MKELVCEFDIWEEVYVREDDAYDLLLVDPLPAPAKAGGSYLLILGLILPHVWRISSSC